MANGHAPVLWLVAGANGVGKTTYARHHIVSYSGTKSFVNLDEVARGLSPFDPEAERVRAQNVTSDFIDELIVRKKPKSFTIESSLTDGIKIPVISAMALGQGWRVHVLYLAVADSQVTRSRGAGLSLTNTKHTANFDRSVAAFRDVACFCNEWWVLENNNEPRLVANGQGRRTMSCDNDLTGLPAALSSQLQSMLIEA
jgi:predicted ABC-type ATPase